MAPAPSPDPSGAMGPQPADGARAEAGTAGERRGRPGKAGWAQQPGCGRARALLRGCPGPGPLRSAPRGSGSHSAPTRPGPAPRKGPSRNKTNREPKGKSSTELPQLCVRNPRGRKAPSRATLPQSKSTGPEWIRSGDPQLLKGPQQPPIPFPAWHRALNTVTVLGAGRCGTQ